MTEYLFSYGTLQSEEVQLANFGRKLAGEVDVLVAHALALIPARTQSPAHAGTTHHRNARYTGIASDVVEGTRFAVTRDELERADAYEAAADYRRVLVRLRSGVDAWMYTSIHGGEA
jgi:gamma-glutamylcyclotransferase (GGCT)/AIG2-like uncharacterized protein YtfP